jgi:ferredoxin-NADP reductase
VLSNPASPSSVLAFATTIHLGLAVLRNHRSAAAGPVGPLAIVSFLLSGLPWIFPSVPGLAAGLALHAIWYLGCEQFWPTSGPVKAMVGSCPGEGIVASSPGVSRASASGGRSPASSTRVPGVGASAAVAGPGPRPAKGFVLTPILAVFDETPNIRTIRLARPDGFDFRAGQFITARVRVDGKEYARCYTISSPPQARGYLEITVKRIGLVSSALHATARPGAPLSVRPPAGSFTYPAGDDRPIVLLAGGVGITPLISMVRHAVDNEPNRPLTLVYSAHSPADFAFRADLALLARRHPQLRVFLAASSGSTHPSVYPGRIDESLLRTAVPDVVGSIVMLCGPVAMIDALKEVLARLGVPQAQVRCERFVASLAAAAGLGEERSAAAAPARAAGYRMTCTRSGKDLQVRPGQTILEAAESGGVSVDSLCRAGVCGTCRVHVSAGEVDCQSTTLDADERSRGFVLACVTTAASDCAVSL